MNIIFLDIDGVLNCETTTASVGNYTGIEDEKVRLFAEIVRQTNAEIVLTSTWKEFWYREESKKEMQDAFANHLDAKLNACGLSVFDKTVDQIFDRGEGILRFIKEYKPESFVILDDNLFDYRETGLAAHLIRTDLLVGMTQEDADRAISILKGQQIKDPLGKHYAKAVQLTKEKGEVNPMILQRELWVGYGTACRILDQMEREKVVIKERKGATVNYIVSSKRKKTRENSEA